MPADALFSNYQEFSRHLRRLHEARRQRVLAGRKERPDRVRLSRIERASILRKAGGRCHICGGVISGNDWEADHVFAHSAGGKHALENYLPAHALCNNYRWHYDTEEFQWILKLGVWFRTHIEKQTAIGQHMGADFVRHEHRRARRRKPKA